MLTIDEEIIIRDLLAVFHCRATVIAQMEDPCFYPEPAEKKVMFPW